MVISATLAIQAACGGDQGMRRAHTNMDWAVEQGASLAPKERSSAEPTVGAGISGSRLPERCLDRLPGPKPGYCDEVPEHARAIVLK